MTSWSWWNSGGSRPKPTRDQLGKVQVTFQGGSVVTQEFGTLPRFEPFVASLNASDRASWWAAKRADGDTHAFLSVSYRYAEPGQAYADIPGRDFTNDLPAFVALVQEAIDNGFYVVPSFSADGQDFNPDGWTYGWQWGMDNMARITAALEPVKDFCAPMGGYELLGPGGNWTSDQLEAFYLQLRSLWPEGVLVLELGSGYCKWREGPNGETGWLTPGGQAIDVFLQEFPQPIDEGDHWDGCQQVAARTLGPAKRNIAPPNDGPWYLEAGTPRGPVLVSAFEYALYWTVRGQLTHAQIALQRAALASLGYATVN